MHDWLLENVTEGAYWPHAFKFSRLVAARLLKLFYSWQYLSLVSLLQCSILLNEHSLSKLDAVGLRMRGEKKKKSSRGAGRAAHKSQATSAPLSSKLQQQPNPHLPPFPPSEKTTKVAESQRRSRLDIPQYLHPLMLFFTVGTEWGTPACGTTIERPPNALQR